MKDTAATISLLVSLSRQLLVTSASLVDRLKASIIANDINLIPKSKHSEIDPLLLEDPVVEGIPLFPSLTTSSPSKGVSSEIHSITSHIPSENANLEGIEALVFHVDRLYNICSRQEGRITSVVKQVLNRRLSRSFIKSDLFKSSVYYLPHIDKEAKVIDRKGSEEIGMELDKSLIPVSDLYERLLFHINGQLVSWHLSPSYRFFSLDQLEQALLSYHASFQNLTSEIFDLQRKLDGMEHRYKELQNQAAMSLGIVVLDMPLIESVISVFKKVLMFIDTWN